MMLAQNSSIKNHSGKLSMINMLFTKPYSKDLIEHLAILNMMLTSERIKLSVYLVTFELSSQTSLCMSVNT